MLLLHPIEHVDPIHVILQKYLYQILSHGIIAISVKRSNRHIDGYKLEILELDNMSVLEMHSLLNRKRPARYLQRKTRAMETRQIIIDSAFELFANKPFSTITVQDILDQAKCSRYSFYKYFNDKYELMKLYYTSFVDELVLSQYDGSNYPDVQARIFQFVRGNKPYFHNIMSLEGPDSFWSFLSRYSSAFFSAVKCENENRPALKEQEKITLLFIVEGAVNVFKDYVCNKKESFSPRQISTLLCELYPTDYYELQESRIDGFRKRFSDAVDSGKKKSPNRQRRVLTAWASDSLGILKR